MKMVKHLLFSVALFFTFAANQSVAQSSGVFTVTDGSVVVTPAWCRINPCLPTVATMSGSFTASFDARGGHILFPTSNIATSPDVGFQLPADPNEDSQGVVREIAFTYEGDALKVSGSVDSRAFDGPLVEYRFVARLGRSEVFTARPDYRKCAAPACGGYFVKLVNKKLTQCADGSLQEECYVASIIYGDGPLAAGQGSFANNTPLLLVGAISPASLGKWGVLYAREAYRSATQYSAQGNFYGVTNNGIMCITTPCFSYDEVLLNVPVRTMKLSDVNLEMSGALPEDIAWAHQLMAEGKTLYAAGRNQKYQGFAGIGVRLVAQQFYLPIKPVRTEN